MPAAGYELRHDRASRASSRTNPLQGGARGRRKAARRGRRGAADPARRAPGRRAWAAAATSPGRSGSPRSLRADPARADRGRQPPRPHQPRCSRRVARRVCLAFPIEGRDGDALPRHRPPRAAAGDRPRRRPRARSASPTDETLRARLRRLARRALDQRGGDRRRSPARRSASCTPPGTRDYAALRDRAPATRYDLRDYIDAVRRRRSPPPTSRSRARAARSSRSPRTACRRPRPYPHATADHQTANARWMADARRGGRDRPTRS